MKKSVLLDLRNLDNPTSGFGQIAFNYAHYFAELDLPDLRFVFLVPENCTMDFGNQVEVVHCTREMKKHTNLLPKVDLWHSVNQQQKIRRIEGETKFLLTIHDLNFLREKNWFRQLKHIFVLQRLVNRAAAITCISGFVGEEIQQHLKLKGKTFQVIYNGVENIVDKPQGKPAFATGRPFFFSIGQIRQKKNFHLLIDVMKEFPDYDLYICGDDHFDFAKTIRKHLAAEQVKNVFLTGKIAEEERIWLYAHCEALLFPSQGEGFGLPAIEAMQFGKPVFVSNCTCLPEITAGHAFVWKDLKTETMMEGIREYLPVFKADASLSEQAKAYANTFTYQRHIEQYLALYRKILQQT